MTSLAEFKNNNSSKMDKQAEMEEAFMFKRVLVVALKDDNILGVFDCTVERRKEVGTNKQEDRDY